MLADQIEQEISEKRSAPLGTDPIGFGGESGIWVGVSQNSEARYFGHSGSLIYINTLYFTVSTTFKVVIKWSDGRFFPTHIAAWVQFLTVEID